VQFPNHWPPVEIKKNRNQRNLRISVKREKILVTGPMFSTEKELKTFLIEHQAWIDKTLQKREEKKAPEPEEVNQNKVFLGGKWIDYKVETHASNRITIEPKSGVLLANIPVDAAKLPLKEVKEIIYKYMAQITLPKEFDSFAKKNGFTYDRLFIRSQKTKWGTCSSRTNISFNWRLIKCPLEIRYYLYAHEASHLVHLNHSKDFWDLVNVYDPDYKKHEKWLKVNEHFLFLFD
jgi:predicted metal-dependent hydrolase